MPFPSLRRLAAAACMTVSAAPLLAQVDGDDVAAITFAVRQDFLNAYARAGTDDAAIRDLVTWQRLRFGDAVFSDYVAFARVRGDWPGQDLLRAEAEALIPASYDPQIVVDWFGDTPPVTGQGAVRLAQALTALRQLDAARDVVRSAWLTLELSEAGQAALLQAFGSDLSDLHAARADALLWRWLTAEAERMLPLLDDDQAALVRARIALIRKTGEPDDVLDAVPAALQGDPGLIYDRFNWLADNGRQTDAMALLSAQSTSAEALGVPWRWASWRRNLARWQMREGNAQAAYDLASRHFVTADASAESYADLEWLSGYLMLRFLDDPAQALVHFEAMSTGALGAITLGRAGYWQGRALEALGRTEDARAAYASGAQHQTSFYGLLAAEKLGVPLDPFLTGAGDPTDWQDAPILQDDLVRAAFALMQAGERGKAVQFFAEIGRRLDGPDIARVSAALAAKGQTYFEVLLGKSAAARGIIVPTAFYPLHPLTTMDLPVAPELALAIARRESEFNTEAGSPVGALGLMQLMPGTASDVSRGLGLPYDKAQLTADWRYNATLGARYLADLTERFGDSPVQIAAGYNAGPGRPRDWMAARGDPRNGDVDVIDWIELIPFNETRNYVQRVTESLPIYAARLSGETGPVRFTDLLIGEGSVVRPTASPGGALSVPAPVTGPTAEVDATAALPRPVARPVRDATVATAGPVATPGTAPTAEGETVVATTAPAAAPPFRPVARPVRADGVQTVAADATAVPAATVPQATAAAVPAIGPATGPRVTLRPILRPGG
ncbi:soluble lytic murein transglycosylase [Loktanella fryxellensis]|uniref:Soluble lytic murein transglycosylase n=1 Tax=Loktanella fryxellensis TaxID=245187 RepID=A0A1H8AYA9_9RHOB|nr:lytic transglycosylase domain-containing protein [Loktanella fryxellensis]SEM75720.1 soluble lytic murein transglycosylase [Loktanella fryxellensis]